MDAQTRKLQFIQDFLKYADDSIVEKFEELLNSLRKKEFEKEIATMTIQQYENHIHNAFDDVKNNKVKSSENLRKEISSWE